jgi:hypothetical protein
LPTADGSGTVIYYDLEAYDGQDTACAEASRAFVAGWTQRLQESSSYAGLYALACNPPMRATPTRRRRQTPSGLLRGTANNFDAG